MVSRHVVARVADIPPGTRSIVTVERRSIGIFNVEGTFYALRNACPHAGGELCRGVLTGFRTSQSPGEYGYVREGRTLRCPWHGWEFDIETGQSWFDPARTRVASFDVAVLPRTDLVDEDLLAAGLEPGPFLAETYPVEVCDAYVVVEL